MRKLLSPQCLIVCALLLAISPQTSLRSECQARVVRTEPEVFPIDQVLAGLVDECSPLERGALVGHVDRVCPRRSRPLAAEVTRGRVDQTA